MTRTRARRLTRTGLALAAISALLAALILYAASQPAPASACLGAALATAFLTWLASPPRPGRRDRRAQPPARPAVTDWRTETHVARFRAEISAWEAEQRTKP